MMDPQSFYSRFSAALPAEKRQLILAMLKKCPSLMPLARRLLEKDRSEPKRVEQLSAEFLRYRPEVREQLLHWALADFPRLKASVRDEIAAKDEREIAETSKALHEILRGSSRNMLSLTEAAAILKADRRAVAKKDILKVSRLANAKSLKDNGRKHKARKISAESVLQLLTRQWDARQ